MFSSFFKNNTETEKFLQISTSECNPIFNVTIQQHVKFFNNTLLNQVTVSTLNSMEKELLFRYRSKIISYHHHKNSFDLLIEGADYGVSAGPSEYQVKKIADNRERLNWYKSQLEFIIENKNTNTNKLNQNG